MQQALFDDICYIVDRGTGEWYLATMCESKLIELRQSYRIMSYSKVDLSERIIDKARSTGKYRLVKLVQDDNLRMRSFHCHVSQLARGTSLAGKSVVTLSEVTDIYTRILSYLDNDGCVMIDDKKYVQYAKGIPTSGTLLLYDEWGELVEAPLALAVSVEKCEQSENVKRLLNGVCRYKDKLVTLNRTILEEYYGSGTLNRKLESKGVRYRRCYYDILMNGIMGSAGGTSYYQNMYGVEEHTVPDLLSACAKYVKKAPRSGIHARRLLPVSQIISGKKSLYCTIPVDAELEVVNDGLEVYQVAGICSNVGYIVKGVLACSVDSARAAFISECKNIYKGCSVKVVSVAYNGRVIQGYKIYPQLLNFMVLRIQACLKTGYREGFNRYHEAICQLAQTCGIVGVTEDGVKYEFANVLAKIKRNPKELDLVSIYMTLIRYFNKCSRGR